MGSPCCGSKSLTSTTLPLALSRQSSASTQEPWTKEAEAPGGTCSKREKQRHQEPGETEWVLLFLFHFFQCLCSDMAAELCGAPSQQRWEGPRLPPAPVGTHPLTPMDRGSLRLLYIADVPLGLILLPSVAVFWAITFSLSFLFRSLKEL